MSLIVPGSPTFGELLRYARKAAGMSQRALAKLLEVSPPYLSDVEHDRRRPLSQSRSITAARRLGISALAMAKTRAASLGYFTLKAPTHSPTSMRAGALLSLAWLDLSPEQLDQLETMALVAMGRAGVDPGKPPGSDS